MKTRALLIPATGTGLALLAVAGFLFGPALAFEAAKRGDFGVSVAIWKPLVWLGDADAQFNVGLSYAKGRGVLANSETAVSWYVRAANSGSPAAQYNLGEHYRLGDGVLQDKREALLWLSKSAAQEYQSAQNNLGMMHAEGSGTDKDLVKAAMWLNRAIANGSETAKVNLANLEKRMTSAQASEAKSLSKRAGRCAKVAEIKTPNFSPKADTCGAA